MYVQIGDQRHQEEGVEGADEEGEEEVLLLRYHQFHLP
jgi:hypothetical protein